MTTQPTPELVQSVISHMNADHAGAILAYVQVFGGIQTAIEAYLRDMDANGMKIRYIEVNGTGEVFIPFKFPLSGAAQIRIELTRMAREARARLEDRSADN